MSLFTSAKWILEITVLFDSCGYTTEEIFYTQIPFQLIRNNKYVLPTGRVSLRFFKHLDLTFFQNKYKEWNFDITAARIIPNLKKQWLDYLLKKYGEEGSEEKSEDREDSEEESEEESEEDSEEESEENGERTV